MFTVLVITAWTLVITAAALLLLLASIPFIGDVFFSNQAMLKFVIWITNQPFSLPFFKVETIEGPTTQYGDLVTQGGFNPWVITPIGIMNAALPDAPKEYAMTAVPVYTLASLFTAIAVILVAVAISELVRLKKKQKISKPFIKILLIALTVMGIIYGQVLILISSGLLLTALILLEGVLLDPEAINNYAEERNLITIYHEEKRFEKEVTKEGKLIGNIDLVLVRNQENLQNQSEKTEQNSNSMLPKGSTKWKLKHEILLEKITKLHELEELLTSSNHGLDDSDYLLEIQNYNESVDEINNSIEILGLEGMPKLPYWEDRQVEEVQVTSENILEELQKTKPYKKWKAKYDALAIRKVELEINKDDGEKMIKKIANFNSECEELNAMAKELGLKEDHFIKPILLGEETSTQTVESVSTDEEILTASTNSFGEEDTTEETIAEEVPFDGTLREAAHELAIQSNVEFASEEEQNENDENQDFVHSYNQTITADFETTTKNTINNAAENLFDDAESVLESFNIPTTNSLLTESTKEVIQDSSKESKYVNDDMNNLTTVVDTNTTSLKTIYDDFGYEQKQVSLQETEKKAKPEQSFDFTKSATFSPETVAEDLASVSEPDEVIMTEEEVASEVKNRMELAINMDLEELSTTDQLVNADIDSIYKDINFSQKSFNADKKETESETVEAKPAVSEAKPTLPLFALAEEKDANDSKIEESKTTFESEFKLPTPAFMNSSASLEKEVEAKPVKQTTHFNPVYHEQVDEKIILMENKMSHIETTIDVWTEKTSTFIKDEFESLASKIEKVEKSVEEIKNVNSPATIIDKLSKKHIYNQK